MSLTLNRRGVTRFVILTRRYAIKIPRFWWHNTFRWDMFLHGLLGNMQEAEFGKTGWPELCPVLWSVPGGWLIVMPRCEPLERELTGAEYEALVDRTDYRVPAENKQDSWGYLNGRLVALDYGDS
jgi:hypothetical protein